MKALCVPSELPHFALCPNRTLQNCVFTCSLPEKSLLLLFLLMPLHSHHHVDVDAVTNERKKVFISKGKFTTKSANRRSSPSWEDWAKQVSEWMSRLDHHVQTASFYGRSTKTHKLEIKRVSSEGQSKQRGGRKGTSRAINNQTSLDLLVCPAFFLLALR